MGNFVHEAGWPVYLVIAFGAVSLVAAARHAMAPRPGGLRLVAASGIAMIIGGLIGLVFGLERSIEYIREIEQSQRLTVFLYGLRESMLSLGLALAVGMVEAALLTISAWRLGPRAEGGAHAVPAQY
jgi:hypothetical protein